MENCTYPGHVPPVDKQYYKFKDKLTPNFAAARLAQPPPEILCYISHLRRTVHTLCAEVSRVSQRSRKSWANRGLAARYAETLLEEQEFFVLPADKGGGYVMTTALQIYVQHVSIFSNDWYQNHDIPDPVRFYEQVSFEYEKLCKLVVGFDDTVSFSSLMHSIGRGFKGVAARLHNTVKTHKAPGSISFRAVHAMSLYSFEGLSAWLCGVLKPIVSKYANLALDANSVIQKLRAIQFARGGDYNVIHADIDDFFMIGEPAYIVRHVSALVGNPKLKLLVQKVLDFLLANQCVTGGCQA